MAVGDLIAYQDQRNPPKKRKLKAQTRDGNESINQSIGPSWRRQQQQQQQQQLQTQEEKEIVKVPHSGCSSPLEGLWIQPVQSAHSSSCMAMPCPVSPCHLKKRGMFLPFTIRHENITYPKNIFSNYFPITVSRFRFLRINFRKLPDTYCICVSCVTLPGWDPCPCRIIFYYRYPI